ncbi:MAG: MBL fold metallo-hydrolase [Gammaproteobacteria bacterium]|nr:MBL fold metallo-hydrolase [Gammaproteobacteria bacterium]
MAVKIPFNYQLDFEYGRMDQLTPNIRRVVARNPSAFSFHGTGTYIIGRGEVAVIDPGPLLDDHIEAILDGLVDEKISHILITHTHTDHSPAASILKQRSGAPTYGYGPHGSGKKLQGIQVEAGGDMDFIPDVIVNHGDVIPGKDWTMECVYTPGHTSNHMCFQLREEKALFTGDHVMAWSTSIISPPDGDMTAYMESLRLLLNRDDDIYWPTHGSSISNPKDYVQTFIAHRLEREAQIIEALNAGHQSITDMVPGMYVDLDEKMYPAAARSVLAAMIRLIDTGKVSCQGEPALESAYKLA